MTQWTPGQRAVINRSKIVTIDRVTPSGMAVVGDVRFSADGHNRVLCKKLEPLTPEIEAEIELFKRARIVGKLAHNAIQHAESWLRDRYGPFAKRTPEAADIAKAERFAAAIKEILA